MKLHSLIQNQCLPISRAEAWAFFSNPKNLEALSPPDVRFEITSPPSERTYEGQIVTYRIQVFPLVRVSWVTEIKALEDGVAFVDEQRFGPYRFWHHRHSFEDIPGGVRMHDVVHYGLGMGPFGAIAHALVVRRKLESIFQFRREALEKRFGKL